MQRYLGQRKELKIYISNEDRIDGKPLYEVLLELAKEIGLAGATVMRAVAGMGAHSEMHTFSVWALSQNVPLIVAIIDTEEKIAAFLGAAEGMIDEGLVTMNDIDVVRYYHPKFAES